VLLIFLVPWSGKRYYTPRLYSAMNLEIVDTNLYLRRVVPVFELETALRSVSHMLNRKIALKCYALSSRLEADKENLRLYVLINT